MRPTPGWYPANEGLPMIESSKPSKLSTLGENHRCVNHIGVCMMNVMIYVCQVSITTYLIEWNKCNRV